MPPKLGIPCIAHKVHGRKNIIAGYLVFTKCFLVGISGKSTVLGGAGEHESHSSCRPLGEEGEEAHESEKEGKIPLQKFVKVTVVVPPSSGSGRRRKWR